MIDDKWQWGGMISNAQLQPVSLAASILIAHALIIASSGRRTDSPDDGSLSCTPVLTIEARDRHTDSAFNYQL